MKDSKKRVIKYFIGIVILIIIILLLLKFCGKKSNYVTFETYGNYTEKLEVVDNKIEKPADPTRKGYVFAGWYLNDELFDFDQEITDDITLVAKWDEVGVLTYKVSFDSDGGTKIDSQVIEADNTIAKPVDPFKSGFTFTGWYLNDELFDFNTKINEKITLKAKWTKDKYVDNSSSNSGSSNSTSGSGSSSSTGSGSGTTPSTPTVIDNTTPTIDSFTLVKATNKITANVVASDNVTTRSNLVVEYSIDGVNYQASNVFTGLVQDTNYIVTVKVTDEAGNVIYDDQTIRTDRIETPTILSITPTTLTNNNVEIKIVENPNYTIQYSLDGVTFINYTGSIIASDNGTISYRYYDGFNYSNVATQTISNMDIILPDDFTPVVTVTTKKLTVTGTTHDNVTTDANLIYSYSIDGTTYQSSNEFDNLDNTRSYTVYEKVVDEAGNERIVTVSGVSLNSIPSPIVTLDITSTTNTDVTATVTGIGTYELQCKKTEDTDYQVCSSPITIGLNTEIKFRLSDGFNYSPVVTKNIDYIDKEAPSINIAPDGNGVYAKTHSTVVTVTDNKAVANTYYAWSNQNTVTPTFTTTFTSGTTITNNTDSGNMYLWVKAVDTAGNSLVQVSSGFALDNTDPSITITDTSESSNKLSISVVGNDADSGIDGYYYSISEDTTDHYSAKQTSGIYVFTGLNNSTTYYIKVKAVDNVGNEKVSNVLTITTADLGAITMSVDNESWSRSKTLTVSNDQVSTEHYYYKVDGDADWTEILTSTFQRVFTANTSIEFKVTDGVNTEITSFNINHIDRINPSFDSISIDRTKLSSTSLTVVATAHDNDPVAEKSDIKGYSFSSDGGVTWSAITSNNSHTINELTAKTDYTIKVRAYDNAGNYVEDSITSTTADDGFIFNPTTGIITGISGLVPGAGLVIPSVINGVTVTGIAGNAFRNQNISSVVLPETLETIGSYAFYQTPLVQDDLIIPKNVTSIATYAFQSNPKVIKNLIIESDIIDIYSSAFNNGNIENVIIKGQATIGAKAFTVSNIKTVDLGHTVSIGNQAFQNNPIVQDTLTIPAECSVIGSSAFNSTTKNINNVVLAGTGSIDVQSAAFTNGTIKNLTVVGNAEFSTNAFSNVHLETIDFGQTTSIGYASFDKNNLVTVTIPNSVTSVLSNSFNVNPTLTSVIVDNTSGALSNAPWGATNATVTYLR